MPVLVDDAASFVVVTGLMHPFGNMAFTNRAVDLETLRDAISALRGMEFPSCFMSTVAIPAESMDVLAAAGFVPAESMPLMALDLDELRLPEAPSGCTMEGVGPDEHAAWVDAMSGGYELPRELVDPMGPSALHGSRDPVLLEYHLVRHEGRPVASALVTVRAGVVGVYCIATHPGYRGRGIGAWVTSAPLMQMRERGFRTAVLQASEMGAPVYRGLGFREYGTMPLLLRTPG